MPSPKLPKLTTAQRSRAEAIFAVKFPEVVRICEYRGRRLKFQDREDVQQLALLRLWQQCIRFAKIRRDGSEINVDLAARGGFSLFITSRNRDAQRATLGAARLYFNGDGDGGGELRPIPAPDTSITVDGVRLTMADARMDAPEVCEAAESRATLQSVGAAVGVTRARIQQLAAQLGGVKIGSEWHFPPDAPERFRRLKAARPPAFRRRPARRSATRQRTRCRVS